MSIWNDLDEYIVESLHERQMCNELEQRRRLLVCPVGKSRDGGD